jgi:RimJ/RimL family protein N-acetyltransferase
LTVFASTIPTSIEFVELRMYEPAMASDLVEAANHRDINRFMSDRFPYPYTVEDASEWISFTMAEPEPLNYAVFEHDRLVGGVGASRLGLERTGTFEIGWWLTPSHWGRGITSAAAVALVDELFANRGAMALWAPVMAPNDASAAVARKIGMELEGTRRSVCLKGGVRYDQLEFGITRAAWASF